jgi:hypothetical protein
MHGMPLPPSTAVSRCGVVDAKEARRKNASSNPIEPQDMNSLAKEADRCRQVLSEQQITMDGPGTILRDIEMMIEFIGPGGLKTSSKRGNLPAVALPELNTRLAHPIKLVLQRPLLQDYPNIAGLYVLLRVMDMARADARRLWIDPEAAQSWKGLNPTEKYFALLEAWLFYADAEVLGGGDHRYTSQLQDNLWFLTNLKTARWKSFREYCHTYPFLDAVSTWNTWLQAQFGLVELKPRPTAGRESKTRGWIMAAARRTAWGEAIAWAIPEAISVGEEEDVETPEPFEFGALQPGLQPHFPEWQRIYVLEKPGFQKGLYIFKVEMDDFRAGGSVWRILAVPAHCSLHELATAILVAFEFIDHDHLYEFRFRDQSGRGRIFYHPYTDEGPYGSEIEIGELGLPDKGVIRFRFDFGDSWRFKLRLERWDPMASGGGDTKVIDSAGRPPRQY